MSLLGDEVVELFFGDNAVSISVSPVDHVLQDCIVSQFSEVLGHFSELLQSDKASLLYVEGDKDLVNFLSAFVVSRSGGHHGEELIEVDLSTAVLVDLSYHLVDSLGLGLDAECVNGNFEFYMNR
jgi:hypothetical protein